MKKKHPGNPPAAGLRRRFFPWLWGLVAAGFALRIAVSLELAFANGMRNSVFAPPGSTDPATYWRLSGEILKGTYEGEFYYQPFYYAVFLPLIRLISGGAAVWGLICAQSILGGAAVACAGLAAARMAGRKAGLLAAALTALSVPLLFYTPFAAIANVQSFLLIATFAAALAATGSPRRTLLWSASAGGLLGLAALTRGNALLLLPGLLAFLFCRGWKCRGKWRSAVAAAVLGATFFALPQVPFILHNTRVRGSFTGPSTASNQVLALGNTPEAPPGGRNPGLPAGPMEYPESYGDFIARAAGRPVPLQMYDWMKREPGAFFELQFRKLLLFWDYREIPNNVSLATDGAASVILRYDILGESALVLALAFAGLLATGRSMWKRRDENLALLWYFILIYWGSTALFYNLSRFRAPVLPLAAVLGAIFAMKLLERVRRKGFRAAFSLVGALAIGGFVTCAANDCYREHFESAVMRLVRPDGTCYRFKDGRFFISDNGPFSFGGWDAVELKPGMRLEKQFARVHRGNGEISIQFWFADSAAELRCRINGKEFVFTASPTPHTVPVYLNKGRVLIEVLDCPPGRAGIVVDRQRDYARSTIDGELAPFEYVMRFRGKR